MVDHVVYLTNETVPVSLVLDLHITHDRFGRSSDPNLNGHLHYPNDIDRSLDETTSLPHLTPPHLCLLQLVRLGGYMVNLWDFDSYRLIGKLTDFLWFQEFNFRNLPVDSSTSVGRSSPKSLNQKSAAPSGRLQFYVLTSTLTGHLSLQIKKIKRRGNIILQKNYFIMNQES